MARRIRYQQGPQGFWTIKKIVIIIIILLFIYVLWDSNGFGSLDNAFGNLSNAFGKANRTG